MGTYLVTSKVNCGNLKEGMSVIIETFQRCKPTQSEIIKAFREKGCTGSGVNNTNNYTVTEIKK